MNIKITAQRTPTPIANYDDITPGLYIDDDGDYIIVPRDGPGSAIAIDNSTLFRWALKEGEAPWNGLKRVTTPTTFTLSFNEGRNT